MTCPSWVLARQAKTFTEAAQNALETAGAETLVPSQRIGMLSQCGKSINRASEYLSRSQEVAHQDDGSFKAQDPGCPLCSCAGVEKSAIHNTRQAHISEISRALDQSIANFWEAMKEEAALRVAQSSLLSLRGSSVAGDDKTEGGGSDVRTGREEQRL